MLNENADDGIGKNQRDVLVLCAKTAGDAGNRVLYGSHIRDVRLNGAGDQGAGRKRLDGKAIDRAGTRPTCGGDAFRRDLNGDRGVGHGIQPARNPADEIALINAVAKCCGATQRKSPY